MKRPPQMKVCVVTGTRAEFGIWRSVLEGIRSSKKLQLQLLVTGMHLQREFGKTVKDIEEAGFEIAARVPMYRKGEAASESLARGIAGMGRAFRELKPGMVMVLGDRLEMLAAGSAAVAERIAIGHVHGGETAPGQWDEQIRHALTKMAQVHFCATKKAGERIVRMGEEKRAVHVVGAPALDGVKDFVARHRELRHMPEAPILLLLHPTSGDATVERKRTAMLLDAIGGRVFSVIGPNNDPGHKGILQAYWEIRVPVTMSVKQEHFWMMLSQASVLIGNSSAGILEAASFGCGVVNIGERQAGRERNGNVIDVGWSAGKSGIEKAIMRARWDKRFWKRLALRKNLYGDGHAAERIVRVLEGLASGEIVVAKRFAD